jgi:hypothetical protein
MSGGNIWAGAIGGGVTGVMLTLPPAASLGTAAFYAWPWIAGGLGGAVNSTITQLGAGNGWSWANFGLTVSVGALLAGLSCNVGAYLEDLAPGMAFASASQEGRVLVGDLLVTLATSFADAALSAVLSSAAAVGKLVAAADVWPAVNLQAMNAAQASTTNVSALPGGADEYWLDPMFTTMSSMITTADQTLVGAGVPAMPGVG